MQRRLSSLPRLEVPPTTTSNDISLLPLPSVSSTIESPQSTGTNDGSGSIATTDHHVLYNDDSTHTSTTHLMSGGTEHAVGHARYLSPSSSRSSVAQSLWPSVTVSSSSKNRNVSSSYLSTSSGSSFALSPPAEAKPAPIKPNYSLNHADFLPIKSLGDGNTSSHAVKQVVHRQTKQLMACKLIPTVPSAYKEIQREIDIHIRSNNSPYIVHFYGTCERPGMINLYIEFMDAGSFDEIYRRAGRVPEQILSITALSVVRGLHYLKTECDVIHRDIKPSNVLANTRGEIKLCDFSVSNVLVNSLAKSYVGCLPYMGPERLSCSFGGPGSSTKSGYTVKSDIWSLGISLIELALAKCPIPPLTTEQIAELMTAKSPPNDVQNPNLKRKNDSQPQMHLSHVALLQFYRDHPSPTLPTEYFSHQFKNFVDSCLHKDPADRPTLDELTNHEFVSSLPDDDGKRQRVATWVLSTMAWHVNRNAHNVPNYGTTKTSLASSYTTTVIVGTELTTEGAAPVELDKLEHSGRKPSTPTPSGDASWYRRIVGGCCR